MAWQGHMWRRSRRDLSYPDSGSNGLADGSNSGEEDSINTFSSASSEKANIGSQDQTVCGQRSQSLYESSLDDHHVCSASRNFLIEPRRRKYASLDFQWDFDEFDQNAVFSGYHLSHDRARSDHSRFTTGRKVSPQIAQSGPPGDMYAGPPPGCFATNSIHPDQVVGVDDVDADIPGLFSEKESGYTDGEYPKHFSISLVCMFLEGAQFILMVLGGKHHRTEMMNTKEIKLN